MTQRTLPRSGAPTLEACLVAGSVALLAGLALADRLVAWMIGEFPSAGWLWQIRFGLLRPIGAYYDLSVLYIGEMSWWVFGGLVVAVAAAIIAGAVSRVRLLRALSSHLYLFIALMLVACSLRYREGIYTPAGRPSELYVAIGTALALLSAFLSVRIHAEYLGFDLSKALPVRRLRAVTSNLAYHLQNALEYGARISTGTNNGMVPLRVRADRERRSSR